MEPFSIEKSGEEKRDLSQGGNYVKKKKWGQTRGHLKGSKKLLHKWETYKPRFFPHSLIMLEKCVAGPPKCYNDNIHSVNSMRGYTFNIFCTKLALGILDSDEISLSSHSRPPAPMTTVLHVTKQLNLICLPGLRREMLHLFWHWPIVEVNCHGSSTYVLLV